MTTVELLSTLRRMDVRVWAHGDRIQFSAPAGTIPETLQSELTQRKPEILKFLKQAAVAANGAGKSIERVSRDGPLPLSFPQRRLWFLNELDPGLPTYNIPEAFLLSGRLDVAALEHALSEIVRRHEVLRTTFPAEQGQPFQRIIAPTPFHLEVIDVSTIPDAERDAELLRLCRLNARRPFDLSSDPMLRATLLKCEKDEHILLLTMHHIASDGWSLSVLCNELTTLYDACSHGKPVSLPELPIQYAEYAVWQQKGLGGHSITDGLTYWKKKLGGKIPVLELPADFSRPAKRTYEGATQSLQLSVKLTENLKTLSRLENATLFMTLAAAFKALLHRYTGQDDILLGTPVAGRDRTETESLIGFFVNTLVLRTDLSGDPSFRELLNRVRETTLGAFAYQDTPFELLAAELQPERSRIHTPIFQVAFALQSAAKEKFEFGGLRAHRFSFDHKTSKFDLSLFMVETPRGLKADIEYSSDLFAPQTIERMLNHFETLLESVAQEPDAKLSELQILTGDERRQLLIEWNDTTSAYPRGKCIHELFQSQSESTPNAVAVTFGNEQLTYGELNARSNQLARFLKRNGVQPGECVGLCMDRSLEILVALLGILKAGGAYVPLDPSYPRERMKYMLEDARVRTVIGQQPLLEKLSLESGCIDFSRAWPEISRESRENTANVSQPDGLAYVMYTSGSTGQPKGVTIPHRGVVRLVKNTDFASFSSEEVFMLGAPVTFDASTLEIWGPLLNGGKLVVPPPGLLSLADLGEAVVRNNVTTLWLTAGLFHLMVDTRIADLKNVRQLIAGGDVLSVPHVKRVLDQLPNCRMINGYGPTENTTFTCCHTITSADDLSISVPIGRPISNTRIYILDRHRQPVPIGVPGELYIAGDGLANGYLNQPALTDERFVSIALPGVPDRRVYRTGDRVRYLSDGSVEFLGRVDFQVKIRGFRIEPEEIAATLNQHPAVRESIVLARQNGTDKQLAAYFVAKPDTKPSGEDLKRFLSGKLPAWMVPQTITKMDSFPLNANGKVDRTALPEPTISSAKTEPLVLISPLEAELIQIWQELLKRPSISSRDNFFDLGGHSLLAVRMMAQVEDTFKRKIPLSTLFAAPTIEKLAQAILEQTGGSCESPLIEIQRGSRRPFFFLHGDLLGGGLYCWNLARYLDADQQFYVLPPQGLEGQPMLPSIEAMAEYHLKAIRSVQPHGPYAIGGTCNGAIIALEIAQRLRAANEAVSALVLVDASARNAQFARLHRAANLVAQLRGMSEPERIAFFQSWRYRSINFSEFWSLPIHQKIVQFIPRLHQIFRRRVAASRLASGRPSAAGSPTTDVRHLALNKYMRLLEAYVPKTYDGPIHLLLSKKHFDSGPDDRETCWHKIVKDLHVNYIPGEHATFTSKNVPLLAGHFQNILNGSTETA